MKFLLIWRSPVTDSPSFLDSNQHLCYNSAEAQTCCLLTFELEIRFAWALLGYALYSAGPWEDYREWSDTSVMVGGVSKEPRLHDPGSPCNTSDVSGICRHHIVLMRGCYDGKNIIRNPKFSWSIFSDNYLIRSRKNALKCFRSYA
jgi:hypothetical protein